MEDFIKSLGIREEGKIYDDERYVIVCDNLSTLQKWFWALTQSDEVDEIQEQSKTNASVIKAQFESEDFDISIYGNVDEDDYKLTVSKRGEN